VVEVIFVKGLRAVVSLTLLFFILPVAAQDGECQMVMNEALAILTASCAEPVANTVCYGYGSVLLEPAQATFVEPGNHIDLSAINTVKTLSLSANVIRGGIAVLTPSLNDQPIYLVMLGAVTLTTDQPALAPLASLHVTAIAEEGACTLPLLILYTESETPVSLILNGQTIALTGVAAFTQANPFDVKLFVLDGAFYAGEQTIQAGQVLIGLSDNRNTIQALSNVRSRKDDESLLVGTVRQVLMAIGLEFADTPPVANSSASTCGDNVIHIVQAGENLFRIGLRYGTTVDAIVAANQLANRDIIYAGQQIIIPCPTTNPGVIANPLPAATVSPDTYPPLGLPDLSDFPFPIMPTLTFPIDLTQP
jgi:LysM repeat protein